MERGKLHKYDYRGGANQKLIRKRIHLENKFAFGSAIPSIKPLKHCHGCESNSPSLGEICFEIPTKKIERSYGHR